MSVHRIRAERAELMTQQDARGVSVGDLVALDARRAGIVKRLDRRARVLEVQPLRQSRATLDKAIRGFSGFTGMDAGAVTTVPQQPAGVAFLIGTLDAVCYTTVRDGKRESYIHRFKKAARPLLASSHDGQQILILGGGYRFTDRGIVDHD